MSPKYHHMPVSGGDRKALKKELAKARANTLLLARQSEIVRAKGESIIRTADRMLCESWNERMWADGEPIDPSPTIDQATNGGFKWLEIECANCRTPNDIDLTTIPHVSTTFVHDLAGRLRCQKCARIKLRPPATLLQLGIKPRGRQHF